MDGFRLLDSAGRKPGRLLVALIGMVDDTFWLMLLNGHAEGVHHQGGAEVR
jgi:hypothetical protein